MSALPFPTSIEQALQGYRRTPVETGESGGHVFRCDARDRPTLYLKGGDGEVAGDITHEMLRLTWLKRRILCPDVQSFIRDGDSAWLLTTAIPGTPAAAYLETRPESRHKTIGSIAEFLRGMHALPIADCPFHAGHQFRMAHARRNIDTGVVDESDFDDARTGWTAEHVWQSMIELLPLPFEQVVTHGDFSLDNILIVDDHVTGCIDVGRLGVADPYQDLAILWNSLGEFGEEAQRQLFEAYGIAAPDQARIEFHLCLDECF
ncbi:MAG: aminoglycoside 3'-phosphotransferase [Gemmatimonadaceae bacterium]|nr:aminoglycoside 3'-phosphotransferase [Gemmatimonadaceae bacterium]